MAGLLPAIAIFRKLGLLLTEIARRTQLTGLDPAGKLIKPARLAIEGRRRRSCGEVSRVR
jgi:hypothetical protein